MDFKLNSLNERQKTLAVEIFSLLGLLVSVIINLYVEKDTNPVGCKIEGTIFNCGDVVNSQYGSVLGIHVSLIGAFYFLLLFAVYFVDLKDDFIIAFLSLVGLGSIIYFILIELILGAFCLYCTTVHIIMIIIFLLVGPQSIRNSLEKIQNRNSK